MVVLVDKPKTFSNRIEAARLWRQVFGVCIGSSHDQGKPLQCGIGELVLFDDGVETAFRPKMAELNVRHIKRDRVFAFRDLHHLLRWHV